MNSSQLPSSLFLTVAMEQHFHFAIHAGHLPAGAAKNAQQFAIRAASPNAVFLKCLCAI
jgi:hypothetical protein